MKNDEFTFDPTNINELEDLIERCLKDQDFLKQNLKNSKERIEFYRDQDYVSTFLTAYKKAIAAKSAATA